MSSWPLWALVLAVVIAGPMVGGPVLRPARQLPVFVVGSNHDATEGACPDVCLQIHPVHLYTLAIVQCLLSWRSWKRGRVLPM